MVELFILNIALLHQFVVFTVFVSQFFPVVNFALVHIMSRDELSHLTEESLHSLPVEKVREWGPHLRRGAQCMLCLRPYVVGQHVRRLPCHHEVAFHVSYCGRHEHFMFSTEGPIFVISLASIHFLCTNSLSNIA